MASTFIKADKVVRGVVGALQREVVLPNLIWMEPGGDFKGAKNDTVTLSIPATTSARKRTMRSGATRTRDSLSEGKVDVKLDTNLYKDVEISDEELTLDLENLGAQMLSPVVTAMAEGWEDEIVDTMTGATYAQSVVWDSSDVHASLVDASIKLDKARAPRAGRAVALGSDLARDVLVDDLIRRYDGSGDSASAALREATILQVAGFRIVTVPGLPPGVGYAFHRTAYAGTSKVPVTPEGVAWGSSFGRDGLSMRAIRQFDASADAWVDILGFDSFVGTDIVEDHGEFNSDDQWVNAEEPDNANGTDLEFIRAVELTAAASA